jgi:hypothetical protein
MPVTNAEMARERGARLLWQRRLGASPHGRGNGRGNILLALERVGRLQADERLTALRAVPLALCRLGHRFLIAHGTGPEIHPGQLQRLLLRVDERDANRLDARL